MHVKHGHPTNMQQINAANTITRNKCINVYDVNAGMVTPDASQPSHTQWWDRVGRAVTTVHSASLLLMSDRVDGMLSEYTHTPTPNHKWGSAMLSSPGTR